MLGGVCDTSSLCARLLWLKMCEHRESAKDDVNICDSDMFSAASVSGFYVVFGVQHVLKSKTNSAKHRISGDSIQTK